MLLLTAANVDKQQSFSFTHGEEQLVFSCEELEMVLGGGDRRGY